MKMSYCSSNPAGIQSCKPASAAARQLGSAAQAADWPRLPEAPAAWGIIWR